MFALGRRLAVALVVLVLCCLASSGCARGVRGVSVELTAAAPGIEQVHFRIANTSLEAETLMQAVRPGPRVVVYPAEDHLLLEGRWRQAGEERSWRSHQPWAKGETLVLELGGAPEGVKVIRTAG